MARPLTDPVLVKPLLVCLVACLTVSLSATLTAQESKDPRDSAAVDAVVTAPVVVDGEVLFHVRGISSLPAGDRARRIRDQVIAAAQDASVTPGSIVVQDDEALSRIQTGSRVIAAVVDADAALEQIDRRVLVRAHLLRIQHGIRLYRENRTPEARWRNAGRALWATALLVFGIVLLAWLRRRVDRFLVRRLDARIRSVEST